MNSSGPDIDLSTWDSAARCMTPSKPYFSKDGSKLYFGIAPVPQKEPEDTLLPEEKYSVDVWNYKDDYLQPQQKP
jgi:hypothetical protein